MSSRAAQLARDEAERVESEDEAAAEGDGSVPENVNPETGEITEPDEAPPTPEPAQITEAMAEEIFKSLERQKASNAREVQKRAKAMWDDLVACPCCSESGPVAGFIFPVLPEPQQTLRREAVRLALGGEAEPEYNDAPDREVCAVCDGWGMVATHSKVDGQKAVPCSRCQGMGHVQSVIVPQVPPAPPTWTPPQQTPAAPGNGVAGTDPWGRPVGHQHFGMSPAQVGT